MHQLYRVEQMLSFQLSSSRFKKNDLFQAYHILTTSQISCKKSELAAIISKILTEDLQNYSKALKFKNISDQGIWQQILKRLQKKLQILNLRGQLLSKKIQEIFNSLKITNINNMSSNRQIRVSQQIIQNIWTTQTKQVQCLCPKAPLNLEQTKKLQICYRCNQQFHSQCFWFPEKQEVFQCPFCYLKFCNPQKEVKQILFGGYLPILKKQKIQYKLNFSLDPKIKADKSLSIQARCIKFNSKNRYEISWPDNAAFSFGKIRLNQFKPLQTNSPLKRRADQPIKLDKNRLQDNQIIIQQRSTSQNGYKLNKKCYHLVTIMAYSELSTQSALHKFQKNQLSIKQSKKFIKDHMYQQVNDIQIQKISISLRCQYYSSRIKIPARSRLCTKHVQPFDLMSFITSSINAKTSIRKWKCPICDKRAYDLVIDRYILNLMNQNPTANQIIFKQNGQPQMILNKQDENDQINQKQNILEKLMIDIQKKNNNLIIDLDDDNQQENGGKFVNQDQKLSNILVNKNNNTISQINEKQKQIQIQKDREKEKDKNKFKQKQSLIIGDSDDQNQPNKIQQTIFPTAHLQKSQTHKIINQVKQKKLNLRQFQTQQNKIKKIRKLNDGSLEVTENFNYFNKQKKNDKNKEINQNINIVQLSSDEEKQSIQIAQQIFNKNAAMQQKLNKSTKKYTIQQFSNKQKQKHSKNSVTNTIKKNQINQEGSQNHNLNHFYKSSSSPMQGHLTSNRLNNKYNEEKTKSYDSVILLDSQNEPEIQRPAEELAILTEKTEQQLDLLALEKLQKLRKSLNKQRKFQITSKDQIVYQKLVDNAMFNMQRWLDEDI